MPVVPSSELAAAFISPALFYGGAAAVAAPILIHLLARRRFKRVRWAAMDFLIDAERRNRRRLRMEEWVLLALRCLAVLFIAAMIARPFITPSGAAALFGGSRTTERVFVLDDSLSMAYEAADGAVFDRAKLAVRRLIESIRRETPDDTVTIIRMSAPAAPVESGVYLERAQAEDLLARLEALRPSQRAVEPAGAMEAVADVLERNPGITNAAVYIISDFQRGDWIGADASRRQNASPGEAGKTARTTGNVEGDRAGIVAPLAEWTRDDRGLRLVLINVGEKDAANIAVTGLGMPGGRLVAGTTGTVSARVANYTSRPLTNLELQLSVGNRKVGGAHSAGPAVLRNIGPGQTASVELEADFLRAGFETVRVELPPDALPADNIRYAAPDVAGAIRVLIVNGEPSADGFNDEVSFLTTALRPEGEVFSGNELAVVNEADLDDTDIDGFHVVVLANVYRVSDPAIERLERFTQRGGGVIFFLGDQVDADLYNTAFYRNGGGLLPAELKEVVRSTGAAHLVVADRLHPVMRGLAREGDPLGLGQVPFFEYFACRIPQSDSPGGPRLIARFDDTDESPAIVEQRFGRGRAVLVTTSADKEWHLWPDHPTFLPVMMELIHHVAYRGDTGMERMVGEVIELPLDPAEFEPDVVVRTPAYPNEREVGLTATPASDGRGLMLSWEHTDTAGIYQFVLRRRETSRGFEPAPASIGRETVRLLAVNVDTRESDLTMAEEDELRRSLAGVPFEYVFGIDKLAQAVGEERTELWRLFLFATAAVLLVEQCLAWFWGRRR